MQVYLDNGASTRVDEKVVKEMLPFFTEKYGNASSTHSKGQEAKTYLEESRAKIARLIKARPDEIIFTAGGTQSNNLTIKGMAFAMKQNKTGKNHIITTKIEHDCVLKACKWLETQGFEVTYLDVDKEGFIDLEKLKQAITEKTFLVSIIHGNNEIGTIQDLEAIGKICKEKKVYFHSDACQSFTKVDINVKKMNLDFLTINSHKIHGPKGVGALYIREDLKKLIVPLNHGGGHEFNIRAGTENVPGIVGFARASELGFKRKHVKNMTKLRDYMIEEIKKIPKVLINGPDNENLDKRLCNNINVSFLGIEGEALGAYLDAKGIQSSTGSACSSKKLEASHVLLAIGRKPEEAHGSTRITLSRFTTKEEIDYVLEVLPKIVEKLRKMSPLWKE